MSPYSSVHTIALEEQHSRLLEELDASSELDGEPDRFHLDLDSEVGLRSVNEAIEDYFGIDDDASDGMPNGPMLYHPDFLETHRADLFIIARSNPEHLDEMFEIISKHFDADQIKELVNLADVFGKDLSGLLQQFKSNALSLEEPVLHGFVAIKNVLGEDSTGIFSIPVELIANHTDRVIDALMLIGEEGLPLLRRFGKEGLEVIEAYKDFFKQADVAVEDDIELIYQTLPLLDVPGHQELFLKILVEAKYHAAELFAALPERVTSADYLELEMLWEDMGDDCIGLVQQHGLRAGQVVAENEDFVDDIIGLVGEGSSDFFASVSEDRWNHDVLEKAERYLEGTGRMYAAQMEDLIDCPRHRNLQEASAEFFNLRNFYRYLWFEQEEVNDSLLKENLLNLDPERLPDLPVAVVLFARSDSVNVFGADIPGNARRTLEELSENYKVFFFEVETKTEITAAIRMIGELHGMSGSFPKRPIDFLSIHAHGRKDLVWLGADLRDDWQVETDRLIADERYISIYDKGLAAQWFSYMRPCGIFDLPVCDVALRLTGEKNVFDLLADELPGLRRFGSRGVTEFRGYEFDYHDERGYVRLPRLTSTIAVRADFDGVDSKFHTNSL